MIMDSRLVKFAALAAALFAASACQSASSSGAAPLAPSSSSSSLGDPAVTGSLKASAPTLVSPANAATMSSLSPSLTVSGGDLTYASGAVQYRFRVIDRVGTIAADSGLVSGATWTPPAPLTPTSQYSWMARSEYRGLTGPWSSSRTFTTPVAPGNDYGNWEPVCQGRLDAELVQCVWSFVRPTNSVEDLEVSKRVAWLLRTRGGALLLKSSGENVVPWLGQNFSASRVCILPEGHLYKIIGDAGPGGANTPGWSDNDVVPPATCLAAIDPRLR
jgi:hypothetical protein